MKKGIIMFSVLIVVMMPIRAFASGTDGEEVLQYTSFTGSKSIFERFDLSYLWEENEFKREAADKGISEDELYERYVDLSLDSDLKFGKAGDIDRGVDASIQATNGSHVYTNVKLIKQTNTYNCGATAMLQVLYGSGSQTKVKGTNDSAKIKELEQVSGTNSVDGTYVYKVKDTLNKYSTRTYYYQSSQNMSIQTLEARISNSLYYNNAPIIHAMTGALPYYEGCNVGHYIAVSDLDTANLNYTTKSYEQLNVTLLDCNYDDQYFGKHVVPLEKVYKSLFGGSMTYRYIIYSN